MKSRKSGLKRQALTLWTHQILQRLTPDLLVNPPNPPSNNLLTWKAPRPHIRSMKQRVVSNYLKARAFVGADDTTTCHG